MPSFAIHLAVAREYVKKCLGDIKNLESFWKGTIAPDLGKNREERNQFHYVKDDDNIVDYGDFFERHQMINDYEKGYLLHLIVDEAFYCYTFQEETSRMRKNHDNFYYDYDCINYTLLQVYDIPQLNETEGYIHQIDGIPKYLNIEKILKFIHHISQISLEEQILNIQKQGKIRI